MEREIKFRAYHKEKKEIFEIASIDFEEKKAALSNGIIKLLNVDFKQFELLQYTGVKDKNNKQIYEGDIVKIIELEGYGEYCDQVEYTGRIECYISEFRIQPLNLKLSDESTVEIEIIGNIYENKNLLEENKWVNTK